mmetsp:Transcript_36087/g.115549  ORF Transcript_36087/g.115549 Transcript_36087/m.115549 type:complete len:340 (+) Transcript_36087:48-1067(+)|eukprot:CAMPEP_0118910970 /NCGR_PEP_ID=MMETSP1166-20130328/12877_1 /TAXON_ID=1104430 /ORGANISM="Chrysoreinhardia sp, Strain CCMP3193" /LENGTH=339 /DNA_ID=CAMNT_0006850447 /DNA_START=10 /DNA_END=1029 /DNA_ORIENTATION=+
MIRVVDLVVGDARRGHLVEMAQDELGHYDYACAYTTVRDDDGSQRTFGSGRRSATELLQLRDALSRDVPGVLVPPLSAAAVSGGDETAVALFATRVVNTPLLRTSRALVAFCADRQSFADIIADMTSFFSADYYFSPPSSSSLPQADDLRAWKQKIDDLTLASSTALEKTTFLVLHADDDTPLLELRRHCDSLRADVDDLIAYLGAMADVSRVMDGLRRRRRRRQGQSQDDDSQGDDSQEFAKAAESRYEETVAQFENHYAARRANLTTKLLKAIADFHASCAEKFGDAALLSAGSSSSSPRGDESPQEEEREAVANGASHPSSPPERRRGDDSCEVSL